MLYTRKQWVQIVLVLSLSVFFCDISSGNGSWQTVAPMNTARHSLATAAVNNKLYAIGGTDNTPTTLSTVEEYDPATDIWQPVDSLNVLQTQGLAATTLNGKVYAMGGINNQSVVFSTVEEYDPSIGAIGEWRTVRSMPTARYSLAAAAVGGKIYAIGGVISGFSTDIVEEYDPIADDWRQVASLPTARGGLAAVSLNGKIYAIGGGSTFSTVEVYDPVTDTWQTAASMPTARRLLAAAEVDGLIYAIGGFDGANSVNLVEVYDPLTNSWQTDCSMSTVRHALAAAVVDNKIYAIGGRAGPGGLRLSTVEEFTPNSAPNSAPTADAGGPYSEQEGGVVQLDASGSSDPDETNTTLIFEWDLDYDGVTFDVHTTGVQPQVGSPTTDDNFSARAIAVRVTDCCGAVDIGTATLEVLNVVPEVGDITIEVNSNPDPAPVLSVGTPIDASASFSDMGILDTHTATWDWGDGTTTGTVTEVSGSGSVDDSHIYTTTGVYTVILTVTDNDNGSGQSTFEFVVIYDPEGGFVTGGGWINSPADTCPDFCGGATGKANFGFVSKYQNGAAVPTGQTEFNFKAGDLNFHSSSYDWLVIAGAKAMYKGAGTVNGDADFTFQLNAIDGQINNGGGVDKFRIKIKQTGGGVIYDNQMGADDNDDPTTVIDGGSIKIHDGNGNAAPPARHTVVGDIHDHLLFPDLIGHEIPKKTELVGNYPNPFNPETWIAYRLAQDADVTLAIYDMSGSVVRTIKVGSQPAAVYESKQKALYWNGLSDSGEQVSSGVYFYHLQAGDFSATRKMLILK